VTPVLPTGPVDPGEPAGPVGPVGPVGPGGPGGPCFGGFPQSRLPKYIFGFVMCLLNIEFSADLKKQGIVINERNKKMLKI
jgi:hypothetical protein